MPDPLSIIRAIVRDELRTVRQAEIAVVTSGFAHSGEGDGNNYECTVKLREGALELRRVPMAVPHLGFASVPQQGDLVLLNFVGGDPNRPVITGRLYSDTVAPPLHADNEFQLFGLPGGQSSIGFDADGAVSVTAGKTVIIVTKDGDITVTGKAALTVKVDGNVSLTCVDCKIEASGAVDLGAGGSGVITEASHKCYITGKPLVPSQTVKAKL